jgi:hypothetical protein
VSQYVSNKRDVTDSVNTEAIYPVFTLCSISTKSLQTLEDVSPSSSRHIFILFLRYADPLQLIEFRYISQLTQLPTGMLPRFMDGCLKEPLLLIRETRAGV